MNNIIRVISKYINTTPVSGCRKVKILGIKTTIPFHQEIVEDEVFMSGNFNTGFIEDFYKRKEKKQK